MQKYVCTVCGYEYDPAEHDNVPFDQLPGWIDQTLLSGVPAVLECYWVLMRGRTIGEDVVQLEPVDAPTAGASVGG